MSENDKNEEKIDLRSIKTPEELGLIAKEIENEVKSEVEAEKKLTGEEEKPKELTDEEKHELFIQQLKESKIKFHPIKYGIKTVKINTFESSFGGSYHKKRQLKNKSIQTNITTNQFGADYRKKRKIKNRMSRASRKANR